MIVTEDRYFIAFERDEQGVWRDQEGDVASPRLIEPLDHLESAASEDLREYRR